MKKEDRWDSLIRYTVELIWPDCDYLLVKAQVRQESGFLAHAVSPAGAKGLMQIMPATAGDIFPELPPYSLFDPETNLTGGILYLSMQYHRFPEIPDYHEKMKFALASYNGGRGYINKALSLARDFEGKFASQAGLWQRWEYSKEKLKSPHCIVNGKLPDWKQIIDYVNNIWRYYEEYLPAPLAKTNRGA